MNHEDHSPVFFLDVKGDRHWTCTCADFVQRHAALGGSYCLHTAQATMQILLAEQAAKVALAKM